MATPYIGEIRMFGANFAPVGWSLCDGSLLPIGEFDTLYNLIGTTYGGDGQQTFAVPDLRGRLPIHQGQQPGQPAYLIGQPGGVETVTVSRDQMPNHTHPFVASTAEATSADPKGAVLAQSPTVNLYFADTANAAMSAKSSSAAGGNQPHDNVMPFQVVNFIIALYGVYPSQS